MSSSFHITREDQDSLESDETTHVVSESHIVKAWYGFGNHIFDVTEIVSHLSQPFFTVSNQLFTDPCVGIVKQLILEFNDKHQQIYPEGCLVGTKTYEMIDNSVLQATYGYQNKRLNVTDIVRQQKLPFRVNNRVFTDPCVGRVKTLIITLRNGQQQSYVEGEQVNPIKWQLKPDMKVQIIPIN
jgi:hypothetical protein